METVKFKPCRDRILVKRDEKEEMSAGGIVLAGNEKPQMGTVMAVGSGRLSGGSLLLLEIQTGQKIIFGKYSGSEIKLNGEKYIVMREDDVLGVVED